MARRSLLTISQVNQLSEEQFSWMFGNAVELCPEAALRVGDKRPFASTTQLCDAFGHYLDSLTETDRVNILNLHPDLASGLVQLGALTVDSCREQAAAGLTAISNDQRNLIAQYNEHYRHKFGFPFIICARENKVKSIIEGLKQRYNNTRAREITTAIDEVKKICRFRILDLVWED